MQGSAYTFAGLPLAAEIVREKFGHQELSLFEDFYLVNPISPFGNKYKTKASIATWVLVICSNMNYYACTKTNMR
jgi:hypothetical protein